MIKEMGEGSLKINLEYLQMIYLLKKGGRAITFSLLNILTAPID
jgi:hypothetical protein